MLNLTITQYDIDKRLWYQQNVMVTDFSYNARPRLRTAIFICQRMITILGYIVVVIMTRNKVKLHDLPTRDIDRVLQRLRLSLIRASRASGGIPLLRVGREVIRGLPLRDENFKVLPFRSSRVPKVLAVDSSIKCILDLGGLKVYLVKIVALYFDGSKTEIAFRGLRLIVANNRGEALRQALFMESDITRELLNSWKTDAVLLDQCLMELPERPRGLRLLVQAVSKSRTLLIGISKSSSITLEDGSPLISYLMLRALMLGYRTWYYHPIFDRLHNLMLGEVTISKLSPKVWYTFRVDVYPPEGRALECALSMIQSLEDPAFPGYPYPLLRAHKEAKIRGYEVYLARSTLLAQPSLRRLVEGEATAFRRVELESRGRYMG